MSAQCEAWEGLPEEDALALDLGGRRICGSPPGRGGLQVEDRSLAKNVEGLANRS